MLLIEIMNLEMLKFDRKIFFFPCFGVIRSIAGVGVGVRVCGDNSWRGSWFAPGIHGCRMRLAPGIHGCKERMTRQEFTG